MLLLPPIEAEVMLKNIEILHPYQYAVN